MSVNKAGLPKYADTDGDKVSVQAKRMIKLVTIMI